MNICKGKAYLFLHFQNSYIMEVPNIRIFSKLIRSGIYNMNCQPLCDSSLWYQYEHYGFKEIFIYVSAQEDHVIAANASYYIQSDKVYYQPQFMDSCLVTFILSFQKLQVFEKCYILFWIKGWTWM